jgi:hypothetical protein
VRLLLLACEMFSLACFLFFAFFFFRRQTNATSLHDQCFLLFAFLEEGCFLGMSIISSFYVWQVQGCYGSKHVVVGWFPGSSG